MLQLQSDPDRARQAEIYAWISADPRHAVAFARAELAWENSERLKTVSTETFTPSSGIDLPVTGIKNGRNRRGIARYFPFMR